MQVNINDDGYEAHESITVRYVNGTLTLLTDDGKKVIEDVDEFTVTTDDW